MIILEDLIDSAAKLSDFHFYKVFVALPHCAISHRSKKNGSLCKGDERTGERLEARRFVQQRAKGREIKRERDRRSEKQALSERGV